MPSIILQVVYTGTEEVVQAMALDAKRFIEGQDGEPFARVFCHEDRSLSLIGKRLEIPSDLLLVPGEQSWRIADQAGVSRRNLSRTIRLLSQAVMATQLYPDEWPDLLQSIGVERRGVEAEGYARAYEDEAVRQALRADLLLGYGPILQWTSTKVVQWLRRTYS